MGHDTRHDAPRQPPGRGRPGRLRGSGRGDLRQPVGLDGGPGSGLGRRAGAGLDRRARRVGPQPDHDPAVHRGSTGDQPAAGPVERRPVRRGRGPGHGSRARVVAGRRAQPGRPLDRRRGRRRGLGGHERHLDRRHRRGRPLRRGPGRPRAHRHQRRWPVGRAGGARARPGRRRDRAGADELPLRRDRRRGLGQGGDAAGQLLARGLRVHRGPPDDAPDDRVPAARPPDQLPRAHARSHDRRGRPPGEPPRQGDPGRRDDGRDQSHPGLRAPARTCCSRSTSR